MQKIVTLATMALTIAVAACSPQSNQGVGPDAVKESKEIAESQQEGYMRIIGDLRWDQMKSIDDWRRMFPDCLVPDSYTPQFYVLRDKDKEDISVDCLASIGGIHFYLVQLHIENDPMAEKGTRVKSVTFNIPRKDQNRAFLSLVDNKYPKVSLEDFNNLLRPCSKYTCFLETDMPLTDSILLLPTPHATAILDNVNINSSSF